MIIGHYVQLTPVRERFIFLRFPSENKINQLLSLQLWLLFKYVELTEVLRQGDHIFAHVLNNIYFDFVDLNTE